MTKNILIEPKRKVRVLIVEDEAIIAKDMEYVLEAIGCESVTASSGEESVRKAEYVRPDVVFMDIRLKGVMDGVEAARQITDALNIPVNLCHVFHRGRCGRPPGASLGLSPRYETVRRARNRTRYQKIAPGLQ